MSEQDLHSEPIEPTVDDPEEVVGELADPSDADDELDLEVSEADLLDQHAPIGEVAVEDEFG